MDTVGVHNPERADNLVWIEGIILDNLDDLKCRDSNCEHSEKLSKEFVKLMIAEVEMRDEDSAENDKIPTLSRIVGARVTFIVNDEDEERNYFWIIKIPSILPDERELARLANVSSREICFYNEILPAIKMWVDSQYIDHLIEFNVPTCFYAKYLRPIDPEPDLEIIDHIRDSESILVLQDLRAAEFGKRHFGEGMCISEALAAITEIAKFHAVSYAMQIKAGEPLGWKELYDYNDMAKLYDYLFQRGYLVFQNFLSNCQDEPDALSIMSAVNQMQANSRRVFGELLKPSTTFPNTLVHMDLWSDNLLFRVKNEDKDSGLPLDECDLECFIIDWQMVALGRPTHDLALLTMLSMNVDDRREYAFILLQYYHQIFEKTVGWFELEMPFTYGALVEEYSTSCVLTIMMAIASMDVVMQEGATQKRLLEAIRDIIEDGIIAAK